MGTAEPNSDECDTIKEFDTELTTGLSNIPFTGSEPCSATSDGRLKSVKVALELSAEHSVSFSFMMARSTTVDLSVKNMCSHKVTVKTDKKVATDRLSIKCRESLCCA